MTYEITTFDVCTPGFERLRNRDEFILVASVWHGMSKSDLTEQFIADIQAVEREDDFDYDAARVAVTEYLADVKMASVLCYVDEPELDEDGEPELDEGGLSAFLYMRQSS